MMVMMWLLVVALLGGVCSGASIPLYPNSQNLLPGFTVYWRIDQAANMIHLQLQAQTLGWVGFGIGESNSGSMPGADIVIGSVVDGVGSVSDRWASTYDLPEVDECQDWVLVASDESGGYTTIEVKRPLDTKDPQDRAIGPGPTRVIAAYGISDNLSYHTERITSEIIFFGNSPVPPLPSNYKTIDLLMGNFTVPDGTTQYACRAFALPNDRKYHVIRIDPIVQTENYFHVHHFIVNICPNTSLAINKYKDAHSCDSTEVAADGCSGMLAGWNAGAGNTYLPEDAGFSMGSDGTQFVMLQTHYNNPQLPPTNGYQDSSGVRLYYTEELRTYDADILVLGDPFILFSKFGKNIPPNSIAAFETECPSECTSQFPHEINIFQSSPHMHTSGYEFWTTQWRDGAQIAEFGRVEFWSYDHQSLTVINITVKPGDRLNTHCAFNSAGRNATTIFGPATTDEMCLHFLGYYPRIISPMTFDYCGYAGPNHTVCGSNRLPFLAHDNPTFPDPPGGMNQTFGVAGPICPYFNDTSSSDSPTPTPTSTPTPPTTPPSTTSKPSKSSAPRLSLPLLGSLLSSLLALLILNH